MIRNLIIIALLCLIAYPAYAGLKDVLPSLLAAASSTVVDTAKMQTDTGGGL